MQQHLKTVPHADWKAEAVRRFGSDPMGWKFVCPSCGHVARVKDWQDAGAPEGAVAFSCIGRYTGDAEAADARTFKNGGGPCNYAGGGLIELNPMTVVFDDGDTRQVFAFAERSELPGTDNP